LKGAPLRAAASHHDTSTSNVEAFYKRHFAKADKFIATFLLSDPPGLFPDPPGDPPSGSH
jgi:hypothetical protein